MRRRWILSLVVAFGATGAVVGATAVSADFPDGVRGGEVLDRVASALGIDRSDLDDAFAQAKSELKNEKQAEMLTALVDNYTINEDEALEIGNWLDGRPEALNSIKLGKLKAFKFHGKGLDPTTSIQKLDIPSVSAEHLARLVETDKLSQEDADVIQNWLDSRPESVDKLIPDSMRAFEGTPSFRHGLSPFRGRFFRFGGHDFKFEFEGDVPEFFSQPRIDGVEQERLRDFGFPEGLSPFHDFTPETLDPTNEPNPVNL